MYRALKMMIIAFAWAASLAIPIFASAPAEAYYRHGGAACGPRGCAAAGCGPHGCAAGATRHPGYYGRPGYRPPAYRPGYPRGVVVVNPNRYWRPGGAIAAGAAIGFVAGATAVAVAGQPPRAGYCWYYTNPSRTTGFWDVCPR